MTSRNKILWVCGIISLILTILILLSKYGGGSISMTPHPEFGSWNPWAIWVVVSITTIGISWLTTESYKNSWSKWFEVFAIICGMAFITKEIQDYNKFRGVVEGIYSYSTTNVAVGLSIIGFFVVMWLLNTKPFSFRKTVGWIIVGIIGFNLITHFFPSTKPLGDVTQTTVTAPTDSTILVLNEYVNIPITFYSDRVTVVEWEPDPNTYRWRRIDDNHPELLVWDHEPREGECPQWIICKDGGLDTLPRTTAPFWMEQAKDMQSTQTVIRYAQHEQSLE